MCQTTLCRDLCKMAESIDLPFGLWTLVVRRAQAQRHLANMIDHLLLLGRIAVQRTYHAAYCYRPIEGGLLDCLSVCLSVCRSLCHNSEPCKNG